MKKRKSKPFEVSSLMYRLIMVIIEFIIAEATYILFQVGEAECEGSALSNLNSDWLQLVHG